MSANDKPDDFENDLTPKQRQFCLEYLRDNNATQAAMRAGYAENSARQQASDLLSKPDIQEEIAKLRAEQAKRIQFSADDLLRMLLDEATADENDLYDEDGNLLPVKEWPLVWRRGLIRGVETEGAAVTDPFTGEKVIKSRVSKIKLADRTRIKELIGRHVGVQAFRDNVALSNPHGGPVEIDVKMSPKEAAETFKRMAEGE